MHGEFMPLFLRPQFYFTNTSRTPHLQLSLSARRVRRLCGLTMAGRAAALSAARCALGAATRPLSSSSSQYVHRASRGRLHRFLRATNGCRTLHTVKRATVAKAYASHSQDGNCHNAALLVAVGLGAAVATDFALGSPVKILQSILTYI